jgi:hypothetical protein
MRENIYSPRDGENAVLWCSNRGFTQFVNKTEQPAYCRGDNSVPVDLELQEVRNATSTHALFGIHDLSNKISWGALFQENFWYRQ